tara:strand:+ start:60 stop:1289 length:1230 start_codon:yes stop_codon:yes gene_type:complete
VKKRKNSGLINEISDMREMMRNLSKPRTNPQQINEQYGGFDECNINNGGCHPDCVCIDLSLAGNSGISGVDCCCGNELITIDGCQPGPCMDHSDCGVGQDCCYADSGMQSMGLTSCNNPNDCHDYPSGVSSNPNSTTSAGCLDPLALNYDTSSNSNWVSNDECCYVHNSGCMMPGMLNYEVSNDCDCNNNWQSIGFGNNGCCLVNTDDTSGGFGSTGSSGGVSTLDDLGIGSTCFIDGSVVLMHDGTEKNISEVKIGEEVKSEIGISKVTGVDIHKGEFEIYSFNGGKPFTTSEHPFKTLEGWKSLNPIKATKTHGITTNILKEGDTLIMLEGEKELKEIIVDDKKHNIVYNLRLDNEHVYYVNGYLVHNAKDGAAGTGSGKGPYRGPKNPINPPKTPKFPQKPQIKRK